jgi:H+/Cl- antiporter ClcA
MESQLDNEELLMCEEPLLSPEAIRQCHLQRKSSTAQRQPVQQHYWFDDSESFHSSVRSFLSPLQTRSRQEKEETARQEGGRELLFQFNDDSNPDENGDNGLDLIRNLLGRSFGTSLAFWKCLVGAIITGFTIGVLAIAFCGLSEWLFELWTSGVLCSPEKEDALSGEVHNIGFKEGDWCWLVITVLGSLLAGIVLVVGSCDPSVLGTVRTVFHEAGDLGLSIDESSKDLKVAPFAILSCFISITCGASVGPEAGLGLIGSRISHWMSRFLFRGDNEEDTRSRAALAMASMAAAMGCLLPSPFLGVLLTLELSLAARPNTFPLGSVAAASSYHHPRDRSGHIPSPPEASHDFMEQIVLMSIAAVTAWSVTDPFRHDGPNKNEDAAALSEDPVGWQQYLSALLLGAICGVMGMIFLLLQGIFKQVAQRLSGRILSSSRSSSMRRLYSVPCLFPLLAGVVYGLIGVAYPLTLGSGYEMLVKVLTLGFKEESLNASAIVTTGDDGNHKELTPAYLCISALMKLITTAISLGFGLVGGQVVPLILAGVCLGFSVAFYAPTLFAPISLTVACCSISIVGSFLPLPLTLTTTMILSSKLPNDFGGPILVSYVVAYTVNNIVFAGCILKKGDTRKEERTKRPAILHLDMNSSSHGSE